MRTIVPTGARLIPKEAKLVFQGVIYAVHQWEQELYDGSIATFEMLSRPDTIQVLAIKEDMLVLIYEEQPTVRPAYGLPGGRHDVDSETELEAAKREVLEETGMTFGNWKLIRAWQPHSKVEQFVYLYLASDFVGQQSQHLDAGEKIEIKLVSLDEARAIAGQDGSRGIPQDLLRGAKTMDDLINLPEYKV